MAAKRKAPSTRKRPTPERRVAPRPVRAAVPPRVALVVLGMHRSGTSAVTRVLNLLGADLPRQVIPAAPDNPLGFFEPVGLYALLDELLAALHSSYDDPLPLPDAWYRSPAIGPFRRRASCLLAEQFDDSPFFVLKDPRLCRLVPFLMEVLTDLDAEARFVLLLRHPLEVAASLHHRERLSPAHGALLWLRYLLDAEHATRGRCRVWLHYADLVRDWRRVMTSVATRLDVAWSRDSALATTQIQAYLDAGERHHRFEPDALALRSDLVAWIRKAYQAARALCAGDEEGPRARLDALRVRFDEAARGFGPLLAATRAELGAAHGRLGELAPAAAQRDALAGRVAAQERRLGELDAEFAAARRAHADDAAQAAAWRAALEAQQRESEQAQEAAAERDAEVTALQAALEERDRRLADQKTALTDRAAAVAAREQQQQQEADRRRAELEAALADRDAHESAARERQTALAAAHREQQVRVAALERELRAAEERLALEATETREQAAQCEAARRTAEEHRRRADAAAQGSAEQTAQLERLRELVDERDRRIAGLEAARAEDAAREAARAAAAEQAALGERAARLEAHAAALEGERAAARAAAAELRRARDEARADARFWHGHFDATVRARSWRLTAPLRAAMGAARRLRAWAAGRYPEVEVRLERAMVDPDRGPPWYRATGPNPEFVLVGPFRAGWTVLGLTAAGDRMCTLVVAVEAADSDDAAVFRGSFVTPTMRWMEGALCLPRPARALRLRFEGAPTAVLLANHVVRRAAAWTGVKLARALRGDGGAPGPWAAALSRRARRRLWDTIALAPGGAGDQGPGAGETVCGGSSPVPGTEPPVPGVTAAPGVIPESAVVGGRRREAARLFQAPPGVNLFGFLSQSLGLSSAARGFLAAARHQALAVHGVEVPLSFGGDAARPPYRPPYRVNLTVLTAELTDRLLRHYGREMLDDRYVIGHWVWELPSFRPDWHGFFPSFDEVWAPTEYCCELIRAVAPVPVVRVPYVVEDLDLLARYERAHFDLPPDAFVFYYTFDVESHLGRKNPVPLVRAFRHAFGAARDVVLLLRCYSSHGQPESGAVTALLAEAGGAPNLVLRYGGLSRAEALSLHRVTDCFVSPHRCEGFGLNLAESMYFGHPVIATDFSGTTDFLNEDNGFPVRYRLREIEEQSGPYFKDYLWAEIDEDHLTERLREVFEQRAEREARGRRAAETIRQGYSARAVGALMARRFEELGLLDETPARFAGFRAPVPTPALDQPPEATPPEYRAAVAALPARPTISVITPVYETPPEWLERCIESVRAQYYPHWELCLCDDGSTRADTRAVLERYRGTDPRIKIARTPQNRGIAGASNRAAEMATGEFLALLDHDDELSPDALFWLAEAIVRDPTIDLLYTDEDKIDADGGFCDHYCKPDFSPEHLMSVMYLLHCLTIRKALFFALDGFRAEYHGAQDYDLALRAARRARRVHHVPKIVYHWRKIPGSAAAVVDAKSWGLQAARRALEDHVRTWGRPARVEDGLLPGTFRVRPEVVGTPPVTLVLTTDDRGGEVPGRGAINFTRHFVRSIVERTDYPNYRLLVVDNANLSAATRAALPTEARVASYRGPQRPFNFARKANFAFAQAETELVVLLNDDMEVIRLDWLTALLEWAQLPEIGAVGGRLLFADGRLQHTGMCLGVAAPAVHMYYGVPRELVGYNGYTHLIRNYSVVTGACLATRRSVIDQVGGFDERLAIDYNDVSFCLAVREAGYRVVFTPYCELHHFERMTAQRDVQNPEEVAHFLARWGPCLEHDPYYNPNLHRNRIDFALADHVRLGRPASLSPTPAAAPVAAEDAVSPAATPPGYRDALAALPARPVMSLLVPVGDTAPAGLAHTLESVGAQYYPHWHLVLCDDDRTPADSRALLERVCGADPRCCRARMPGAPGRARVLNHAAARATGEFLTILETGDALSPDALYWLAESATRGTAPDLLYTDEVTMTPEGAVRDHCCKPDFSPEHLLSTMYLGHLLLVRRTLWHELDGYREDHDGAEDHDFGLRVARRARRVCHVPRLVYHRRPRTGNGATANAAPPAARRALEDHVRTWEPPARVEDGLLPGTFRVRPAVVGMPPVTLLVLTGYQRGTVLGRGRVIFAVNFARSIAEHTDYPHYELVIVDDGNHSAPARTSWPARARIVSDRGGTPPFNFARKANFAFAQAETELVVLLNDDMEVIRPDWLTALVEWASVPEIGAVGGRLLFADGSLQHAGIGVGNGLATHPGYGAAPGFVGYQGFTHVIRNCSGVTAACLATRRTVVREVGGFDEHLAVDFNDVAFGLALRERGYRIVYTPYCELYHFEGQSLHHRTPSAADHAYFVDRWRHALARPDPFYNPNFRRGSYDFELADDVRPGEPVPIDDRPGGGAA